MSYPRTPRARKRCPTCGSEQRQRPLLTEDGENWTPCPDLFHTGRQPQERSNPRKITETEALAAMPHQDDRYEIQRLRKRLDEAVEALERIAKSNNPYYSSTGNLDRAVTIARDTLTHLRTPAPREEA